MIYQGKKLTNRVRITHEFDIHKGKIGYILELIDQHSLCTYVVVFKGVEGKRAYQRDDFKFLKSTYWYNH